MAKIKTLKKANKSKHSKQHYKCAYCKNIISDNSTIYKSNALYNSAMYKGILICDRCLDVLQK